jgi:glycosyltransferase involved in cell wall biosynthesis
MKIVYFVHCFFPEHFYGSETYTLNVAKFLQSVGHDVHIVTARFPGEQKAKEFVSNYEYEGLSVTSFDKNVLPNTRIKDTYYQDDMRQPVRDIIEELQPDIVHVVHLINHTAVLLEVLQELKIPVVATFTDFFGFCFNNKLQAADNKLCSGPSSSRVNCIACFLKATSDKHTNSLLKKSVSTAPWVNISAEIINVVEKAIPSRLPHEYRSVIPDLKSRPDILEACYQHYWAAIAPSKFLEKAYLANGFKKPLHLQNFGVDIDRAEKPNRGDEPLRVGYIGQIAAHKGVDILVEAFKRIENAKLVIYGPEDQDKGYVSSLRKNAESCLSEVNFLGTFEPDRMASIMRELDFIVIPSTWYENSPLVLLYALATHTPAIVSDVEGMTEFVKDGENGFVFPMGSAKNLAVILDEISKDPIKARDISANTSYLRSTSDMADDVLRLYKEQLGVNA